VILIYVTLSDPRERRVSFLVNRLPLTTSTALRTGFAFAEFILNEMKGYGSE